MGDPTDTSLLEFMQVLFWHKPFYLVMFVFCLFSLILFWKRMENGRRLFLAYSLICMFLFIYNPLFIALCERFFLHGARVIVRIFLILPIVFIEAYVFANLISIASQKNKTVSACLTAILVILFIVFGNTPWQKYNNTLDRELNNRNCSMIILAENLYKIPQEHIDICEAILSDMDGERTTLSLFEMHDINDVGGTLNYSIRMYTSRIQLREVISSDLYNTMSYDERMYYWDSYMMLIQDESTDSNAYYFLFPVGDVRASDLLLYGCYEMPINSSTYCLLVYTS